MIAAIAILRRFWPALAIAGILLGAWIYVGHVDRTARAEQKREDSLAVAAAQDAARIADISHARAVEAAQTAKKEKADDDLAPALADARARLAAYVTRMRNQTNQGSGSGAHMPNTTEGTPLVDGPDRDAVVPFSDLRICTEAVTRLQNASGWAKDTLGPR